MKYSPHYYTSNIQGTKIRNAVTGETYENCYVGSFAENKFFKVIDSTGKYDQEGNIVRGNRNPNKLFFESISQFKEFYKIGENNGYEFLNKEF
mgnify:CR=1 FL=1|tara:strand:- start:8 stop:286 length:279 start_codon:yes stop_codon:yes gene_type:complete